MSMRISTCFCPASCRRAPSAFTETCLPSHIPHPSPTSPVSELRQTSFCSGHETVQIVLMHIVNLRITDGVLTLAHSAMRMPSSNPCRTGQLADLPRRSEPRTCSVPWLQPSESRQPQHVSRMPLRRAHRCEVVQIRDHNLSARGRQRLARGHTNLSRGAAGFSLGACT